MTLLTANIHRTTLCPSDGGICLLLVLAGYLAASLVGSVVLLALSVSEVTSLVLSAVVTQAGLAGGFLLFCRVRKFSVKSAFGYEKAPPLALGLLTPVLVAVSIFATLLLAMSFDSLLQLTGYRSLGGFAVDITGAGDYLLLVFALALLPAIFEEAVFRGALLSATKKLGVIPACLLNGALFMIFHANPDQVVHQFFLGILLSYLVLRTGSIWLGMIGHFANNLIALFLPDALFAFEINGVLAFGLGLAAVVVFLIGATLVVDLLLKEHKNHPLIWAATGGGAINPATLLRREAFERGTLADCKRGFTAPYGVDPALALEHKAALYRRRGDQTGAILLAVVATVFAGLWALTMWLGIFTSVIPGLL
ncbi:MAG: CPBP family intramembrane metalloprotease [Clostridiales bacterium]|jgi:membrane protease YdiL (CAAX protease family)|nr:CPBP family intramembrane metalloprotease [Clostridiales bacterium]